MPQEDVEDCNIGIDEEMNNVKILASLPKDIKDKYINLLKHYKYLFS